MVDYDIELWEVKTGEATLVMTLAELERAEAAQGPEAPERIAIISAPGKLLSLTAGEAYRYGLARGLADEQEDLLALLGAEKIVEESSPSASDSIIAFLVSGPVQGVLILIGLVMMFLEIQSPGFGIPGTAAIISFLLVFGSSFLLGRVTSLEMILFILGLGLLAIEIFVIPGFGFVGILGILIIVCSLILSMQDFVIPSIAWEWNLLGRNALVVFLGLIAAITGIAVIALLGPRTKIFDRIMLKTQIDQTASDGRGWKNDGGLEWDYQSLLGLTGKALTFLHPIGRAEFNGENFQVESDDSFVEAGSQIKVVRIRGNIIFVRSV
jgi:membrane-bound serine protease (ClpP class)